MTLYLVSGRKYSYYEYYLTIREENDYIEEEDALAYIVEFYRRRSYNVPVDVFILDDCFYRQGQHGPCVIVGNAISINEGELLNELIIVPNQGERIYVVQQASD